MRVIRRKLDEFADAACRVTIHMLADHLERQADEMEQGELDPWVMGNVAGRRETVVFLRAFADMHDGSGK